LRNHLGENRAAEAIIATAEIDQQEKGVADPIRRLTGGRRDRGGLILSSGFQLCALCALL
jgi:hypothetical protein